MIRPAGKFHGRLRAPVFSLLLILAPGASTWAHPDDQDLRRDLDACARIAAGPERLACFDALASREPESVAGEMEAVTAKIQRLERRPYGERVFHLSNGQVWTELEAGRARYREGLEVRIEQTPFGGYMLSTEEGRATRVKRVL